MSHTTIDESAVVPVTVLEMCITAVSAVFFGFLCRYTFVCMANEKELEKSDEELECCFGVYLSSVHGWAVAYFCFLLMYALSVLMLTTIWGFRPSCFLAVAFQAAGWIGAKTCQYGFFINRLEIVFKGSAYKMRPTMKRILSFFATLYAVGNTVIIVHAHIRLGPVHMVKVGRFGVCVGNASEFQVDTLIAGILYLLCDSVIMISVAYGFISRLLKLATISPNDRTLVKTLGLAFKSFVLYLFSVVTSVMNFLVVGAYPHNLIGPFSPLFDTFLNGLAIYAMFRFGDNLYRVCCAHFNPCVVGLLLCCCARGDESLRDLLVQSQESDNEAFRPKHQFASATAIAETNVC